MSAQTPTSTWPSPASGTLTGPWVQGFYFTVDRPKSKSNYRHSQAGRAQWAQLAAFTERVQLAARAARPRGWDPGDPAAHPSTRPRVVAVMFARTRLDTGNLDKSILDAVQAPARRGPVPPTAGVVMVDDAQVAASLAFTEPASDDTGAVIAFARLPADATPAQVAHAGAGLLTQIAQLITPPLLEAARP